MSLRGKICLITGASFGIGRETALALARQQAHVIIGGRDLERTRKTQEWLIKESQNDKVDFLIADLSSLKEVRKLAAEFKRKFSRLDVLINNAGGVFTKRELTVDGFEHTWALNHLSYFLLTLELQDILKASAPSRIVNVASGAHKRGTIDFENLQGEKEFKPFIIYSTTKLANILFTYALARRLAGTGVTANCLHPGVVSTGFGKNNPGLMKLFLVLAKPFLLTAKEGAETSIYLANSSEVEGVTAKYFVKSKAQASSAESLNVDLQERLWTLSLHQVQSA